MSLNTKPLDSCADPVGEGRQGVKTPLENHKAIGFPTCKNIIKKLVSSERVHNNCELPVGIYNNCECLV